MALVLLFFGWFCWLLVDIINSLFALEAPEMSLYLQMAGSLTGILFIWYWGMIAAVDVAVQRGLRRPDEHSAFWAVLMSWLCPGSGQVYTGSRGFGFGLFACYLATTLLLFPAYKHEIDVIRSLLSPTTMQFSPYTALTVIQEASFRLDYGPAQLAVMAVESASMILAAVAMRPTWYASFQKARLRRLQRDPDGKAPSDRNLPFAERTEARVLSILALGWICPGSSQLLLQQTVLGWSLFCLYVGGKIGIGLLLTSDIITYATAQSWSWIPSLAMVISMVAGLVSVTARPKPSAAGTPL